MGKLIPEFMYSVLQRGSIRGLSDTQTSGLELRDFSLAPGPELILSALLAV